MRKQTAALIQYNLKNPIPRPFKHRNSQKERWRARRRIENTLLEDKALQRYFIKIKNRHRNQGYLSPQTERTTIATLIRFFEFLQIPFEKDTLTNLVRYKLAYPQDFALDDKIEEFETLEPIKWHHGMASRIIGILKANRCNVVAKSETHFATKKTKYIPAPIRCDP